MPDLRYLHLLMRLSWMSMCLCLRKALMYLSEPDTSALSGQDTSVL